MHLHKTNRFFVNGTPAYPEIAKLEYIDEYDNEICAYRRRINTEMVLANTKTPSLTDTFSELLELEQQRDICYKIDFDIERDCEDATYETFVGTLNLRDGSWNCDTCKFRTTPVPNDKFSCITDTWKENKNFLDITDRVSIDTLIGEVQCQTRTGPTVIAPNVPPPPAAPNGYGWTVTVKTIREEQFNTNSDTTVKCIIRYCRECLTTAPPVGSTGWVQDGANWYRALAVGNANTQLDTTIGSQDPNDPDSSIETDFITTYEIVDFEADSGITLESLIKFYNPDCCIKSDFFGIDPDGTAPNNSFYQYAYAWLQDIIVFQSSDIILANASENAFNAGTDGIDAGDKNFCDLWADMKKLFNLIMVCDVDTGCIRFEHKSYITSRDILDLTKYADGVYLHGTGKWTYDSSDYPSREIWRHPFGTSSKDFDGAYVQYDSNCTNGQEEKCQLECIMTNVSKMYNNDKYAEDDDKLQTITFVSTSNGQINSLPGAFSGTQQLNGPLAFPQLVQNLHICERPLSGGTMNDQIYSFLSVRRSRKQSVTIQICCDDYFSGRFSPEMLVRTKLGLGEVIRASYCDPGDKLTLELAF